MPPESTVFSRSRVGTLTRFLARFLFRFCVRFHVLLLVPFDVWFFFDFLSDFFKGGPDSVGIRSLDFKFMRECMKINKIRHKFHFLTKIEIKMTYLVFLSCLSLSLRPQSYLEAVLSTFKILSGTNNRPKNWLVRFFVRVLVRCFVQMLSDFFSNFLSDFLSVSCPFFVRFLVRLIVRFCRVSRKWRPRKRSWTEVKVNNSLIRRRVVSIFPQGQ